MPDAELTYFLQTVQRAKTSEGRGTAFIPDICKEIGVHVPLATAREHGDNHLALVLLPASNLAGSRLTKISIFIVPEQPVQIQEEYTTC